MTRGRMVLHRGKLTTYLAGLAARPCQWGVDDCTMAAARWAERASGRAIAHQAYRSEAEARAIIAAAGGLLPLWEQVLGDAGFCENGAPDYGDIGLLTMSFGPVGVIMTADGICALRTEAGITFVRLRHALKFWSV